MPFETGPKGAKVLVYEYVPHGSLLEYIMGKFPLVSSHNKHMKPIEKNRAEKENSYLLIFLEFRKTRKKLNVEAKSKHSYWSS